VNIHNEVMSSAGTPLRVDLWRERFRKSPLACGVIASLEGRAQEIWAHTFDLLRKESPEYRNAVDDEFTAESKAHCGELLKAIVAIPSSRLRNFRAVEFVRRHAEWRARHQVPLVASLHAYRLAHKTYWSISRESLARHPKQKQALQALTLLSDFWIELFEAVGAILEEAHTAEEARIVAQHTSAHAAVIDDLLRGTEPASSEGQQLLTLCGMRNSKTAAIALVRPFPEDDARHVDNEVSQRSLVRLLNQLLPSSTFGKLIGARNGEIVVIANSDGDPAARVMRALDRGGIGKKTGAPRTAAGIGLDTRDFADLPQSLSEARIALDLAGPRRALVRFADLDLNEVIVHRTEKTLLGLVTARVRSIHSGQQGIELAGTVRAFAECSLNVKKTARKLDVHPNTIYFRLNQVRARTGIDPRTFSGASLLLNSFLLLDSHGKRKTPNKVT